MICRLCLVEIEPTKSIKVFAHHGRDELISDMITNFAFVEVAEHDGLSEVICSICFDHLNFVYQFKQLIIKSDTHLRQQLHTPAAKTEDTDSTNSTTDQPEVVYFSSEIDIKTEEEEQDILNHDVLNIGDDTNLVENDKYNAEEDCKNGDSSKEQQKSDLTVNIDSVEGKVTKQVFKCHECPNTFKSRYKLKLHRVTHAESLPYKCDMCDKGFIYNFRLINHKRTHSDERPFKCGKCPKSFKSQSAQYQHRRYHAGVRPFKCKICDKAFVTSEDLDVHSNTHSKTTLVVCEICGKSFRNKSSLYRHSQVHSNETTQQSCTVCGKVLANSEYLRRHIKNIHSETKVRFPCGICGTQFTTKTSLKIHMRIHDGVKPYSCDICGKSFTQSCAANLHKRVHTGETPFHCDFCERRFAYKHHLKKHVEKEHPQ